MKGKVVGSVMHRNVARDLVVCTGAALAGVAAAYLIASRVLQSRGARSTTAPFRASTTVAARGPLFETIVEASAARCEGNALVQRGDYRSALDHYQHALDLLARFDRDDNGGCGCEPAATQCPVNMALEQRVLALANSSLALMKLQSHREAAACATEGINAPHLVRWKCDHCAASAVWEPSVDLQAKLLFRRASAFAAAGLKELAVADLRAASSLTKGCNDAVEGMLLKLTLS